MKVIGLTGGIGTGKSVVAAVWAERGATILTADHYGYRVLQENQTARRELQRHFGPDILASDGTVNRALVARRAFASPQTTRLLNRIVGRRLVRLLRRDIRELRRQPGGVLVVDAALLCEWQTDIRFDLRVLVTAPLASRLKWLARRGLTAREARRRMAAQWPDARRKLWADLEIRNDGTLRQLRRLAAGIWEHITESD